MKFVFICEFNKNVGLGHFDRCLNFADFLRNNDHDCSFLTFNSEKKLIKSFDVYKNYNFNNIPEKLLNHQEVVNFYNYVRKFRPDYLIFDSYKIKYNFYKKFSKFNINTIVIADFINKKYFCDLLINPNSNNNFFNKKNNSYSISGLSYQFTNTKLFKKNISKDVCKSALVYLGSTKKINFIKKILRKLRLFFNENLTFKIILKDNRIFKEKFIKQIKFLSHKNLSKEIDRSKFIISAGGTFLLKCIMKDKVILVFKTANNQNELLKYLEKYKRIIFFKNLKFNIGKRKFMKKFLLMKNIQNYNLLKNKKQKLKNLLKILNSINKTRVILEEKNKSQINEILKIQNEKDTRKFANNNSKISSKNHNKWFREMIKNKNYYHYIIKKNFTSIGILSYKLIKGRYLLSIIIKKKFRNKNYAFKAIKISLNYRELLNKKITAEVKKDNYNSVRLFRKLDFSLNKKSKLFMKVI